MPELTGNLVEDERIARETLRAKLQSLTSAGTWHARERSADTLAEYMELLKFVDSANGNQKRVRGGFVKFLNFRAATEDASLCRTPVYCVYQVEFIMQFEDKRKDGTNSSDDFTRLQLEFYEAVENDDSLGVGGAVFTLPTPESESEVELFDKFDAHLCAYRLECLLYGD